ncbi:MAG TPA: alanine--tRNA ligase [Candidatus Acidoferrales bacterium]|nr:alanine--tRNA ligase [Candidatus Acidoferrales bacterium]
MTGNEIREMFLRFFEERGHRRVRSSSLVPLNDPTLLFTNAGMNQFKDVFLGLDKRDYVRATSCQKCVRAGGKHNDLENVGFTNRHLTFFQMLGNFSFGDYFKEGAIEFAWELLLSEKWYGLPLDKLYFTVFGGAEVAPGNTLGVDEDAKKLWIETGAPRERVFAIPGLKENFWAMGDTGPCGPCSEIFYDLGPEASEDGHTDCAFPCECGRYTEIWNLVFMQFNRAANGTLAPLPKPSVDTGMGLERIAAVLLHQEDPSKGSIFETDLFLPLIAEASRLTGADAKKTENQPSLRIIADHSRSATFLISDGVVPSNEGRGYVLRKIIRRGLRHGKLIGATRPFMSEMAQAVYTRERDGYPELNETIDRVRKVLAAEESRFARTIDIGLKKLDEELAPIAKALQANPKNPQVYSGENAFKLYDTYGLPLDFIVDAARDLGIAFDGDGFDTAMTAQRTRAKASWKGGHKDVANPIYTKLAELYKTEPGFYQGAAARDCKIEAIVTKNGSVNEIKAGEEAEIVLDRTAIYSESGGQVSDTGKLYDNAESMELADVKGAYYPVAGLIAHKIIAKENLRVGDRVATLADGARREHIKRNHTGTHLMHAALRNILGTHVKQAGSLVEPGRLRFDFSHFAPVDPAELSDIEQQVNDEIRLNNAMQTDIMPLDEALASGALAFFGDRYPEANVRVVTIPDSSSPRGFYSKELCGGTHVVRTGDIGVFKIAMESSVAAGVRRIEALTGVRAMEEFARAEVTLRALAARLNSAPEELEAAVQKLIDARKDLEKQLGAAQRAAAQGSVDELMGRVREVKGVKVVSAQVPTMPREALRGLVDTLRQKLGSGAVVLGMVEDGKVALIGGVTKDLTTKLHAGKIIQALAKEVGGSGGGRPDLAEAGGKDTSALNRTLDLVPALIDRML